MKTIVFTAILGDCDSLKPAPIGADRCVLFTDQRFRDTQGWDVVRMTVQGDPRREAWRLRCLPERLFATYDRVIWIDASFTLHHLRKLLKDTGRAKIAALRHHERQSPYHEALRLVRNGQATKDEAQQQIDDYQGFRFVPTHLSISCILVRDRSPEVQGFGETWHEQITKYPGDNTQVSLDFSAWRHNLTIAALDGSRHVNPYASHDHIDHRDRRKPYRPAVPA